jgi:nucleoside-diphosphate-sugar epimerase
MFVFVTGATGFIGSRVVDELLGAGHDVLGLTRSDAGAAALVAKGARAHRGTLEDPAALCAGAAQCDAVIHLAFDHDFSNFQANCDKDKRVISAFGETLAGSSRPLLITSGVGMGMPAHGQLAVETVLNFEHPNPRIASELAGAAVASTGVDVRVVRLPQVHDTNRFGLITYAMDIAREKGMSAYVEDGGNRYSAVHVSDAARLYRLALEKGAAGERYHPVAEEGVPMKDIAETIGRVLGIPTASLSAEEAEAHFGWMAMFAGFDLPASSQLTRERLGWRPTGPSLLDDLGRYRESSSLGA